MYDFEFNWLLRTHENSTHRMFLKPRLSYTPYRRYEKVRRLTDKWTESQMENMRNTMSLSRAGILRTDLQKNFEKSQADFSKVDNNKKQFSII